MKKVILLLLLGVSTVSFAAVAPVESTTVRKPGVSRPDTTKMKMMVKAKTLPNSVGTESVSQLQRYNGVLTMDNVKAIENMSAMMQDNPNALMQQMTGLKEEELPFTVDQRKMGSDEVADSYVKSPETDDPGEKFGSINTPELTGSFAAVRGSDAELKKMHANALKQIETIGHENLGQKEVPVRMPLTVKEVKEMGIDTRKLPRGWEKALEESEKNRKLYQEQEARKKTGATSNDKAQTPAVKQNQTTQQQKAAASVKTQQRTR